MTFSLVWTMPNVKILTAVPAASIDAANVQMAALFGAPGEINFTLGYSVDGQLPATHAVANTTMEQSMGDAWEAWISTESGCDSHRYTGRPNLVNLIFTEFGLVAVGA